MRQSSYSNGSCRRHRHELIYKLLARRKLRLMVTTAKAVCFLSALILSSCSRSDTDAFSGNVNMDGVGERQKTSATIIPSREPLWNINDFLSNLRTRRPLNHSRLRFTRGTHEHRQLHRTNALELLSLYQQNHMAFIPDMFPGCHVAHHNASWIRAVEMLTDSEVAGYLNLGMEQNDVILDPETLSISVINLNCTHDKIMYCESSCTNFFRFLRGTGIDAVFFMNGIYEFT